MATYRLANLPKPKGPLGFCATCAAIYLAGRENIQRDLLLAEMQKADIYDGGVYEIALEPFNYKTERDIPILEEAVTWGHSWFFPDHELPTCWTHLIPKLPVKSEKQPEQEYVSPVWQAPRRGRRDDGTDGTEQSISGIDLA